MTNAGTAVEPGLEQRLVDLEQRLRRLGSVMVAFSGGADSAFLLAAAVRALGTENVVAATAVSPSLPASELEQAAAFARDQGVRHVTPSTDELSRDRKSTRLNSSHVANSYAVFCLKKNNYR